jgi:hypothetical protein
MPTGVSLFVWLPEERAKWVEMRAKHEYWCAILGLNQRTSGRRNNKHGLLQMCDLGTRAVTWTLAITL